MGDFISEAKNTAVNIFLPGTSMVTNISMMIGIAIVVLSIILLLTGLTSAGIVLMVLGLIIALIKPTYNVMLGRSPFAV